MAIIKNTSTQSARQRLACLKFVERYKTLAVERGCDDYLFLNFPLTGSKISFSLIKKLAEIYPHNSNSGSLNSTQMPSHELFML